MKNHPQVTRVALALLVIAAGAGAEVTMSLTITGDADELLAIIQHLRELGYGTGEFDSGDPLKLRMNSVETERPDLPSDNPPPPALVLGNPFVSPASAAPGDRIYLTVEVLDDGHVVDTVAARYLDQSVDLFDNGMHGDAIAGDGIWSAAIMLPESVALGIYLVEIVAYDAEGLPLSDPLDDTRPLTTEIEFEVVR